MTIKKQKNKVSEMTINGLAVMMAGSFKKQDDKMDGLFKKQDDRIDSLFKKQDDKMDGLFKKQDDKMDGLFKKQDDKMDGLFKKQDDKMDGLFKKQDDRIDSLFKKQDDKMDALFKKQEKITDEKIDDLAGMVKRGFDATSKEIGGVREDLAVVKEKVENIEKFIFQQQNPRIQKVEKRLYHIEEVLMLNK